MNEIKICLIMTDAVSFNILCRGQLEYLSSKPNIKLTILCGGENLEIERLKSRKVGEIYDLNFVRPPSLYKDMVSLFRLTAFLVRNKFNLVVYSTPKALLLGSIAAYLTRQPNRTAIIRGRVYENLSGLRRKFYEILDKVSCRLSHKSIFISDSLMKAYLQEGLISSSKCLVLGSGSSNGVSIKEFSSVRRDPLFKKNFLESLNFSVDDFVAISIGRICPDKGFFDLAEVIEKTSNDKIKFIIVGRIEDSASERHLKYVIRKHGNVVYLPHSDKVSELFGISDVHLFLSHREGFGNVAIEAAASGVPTLAYDVVGVMDSVSHNISGLRFELGDTSAIAEYIDHSANNKESFKSSFPHCSQWAKENFDQKKVWDEYLRFYLESSS